MPADVTVPIVDEYLGSSVIYEEHKGNFAEARRVAEERLESARQGDNPTELADALLARGVVHLLQGEPPSALACLGQIKHVVPRDAERQLRAVAYANLATYLRFNAFPNGSGANGTEFQALQDDFLGQVGELSQSWVDLESRVTEPAVQLEDQLVYGLLSNVLVIRSFLDYPGLKAKEQTEQLLNQALQVPLTFQQQAEALRVAPGLIAYAKLVVADLCRRAGQHEAAQEFLSQASTDYRQAGDSAGLAVCRVTQGDWLAAPFSTPLVANFAIQDSGQQDSDLGWTLEAAEFSRAGIDAEGARTAYGEAEQLFAEANAPRGLAAMQLRYGYLAQLRQEYDAAVGYYKQAQEGFWTSGDRLGCSLSRVHRCLSLIGAGQLPEDLATAQDIGKWGATEGSFSYALGLGVLCSRAGRFWLIREGDYERALACHRLAETLFQQLDALHNVAQGLVDQGNIYKIIGEAAAAVDAYERAWNLLVESTSSRPRAVATTWKQAIMLSIEVYQTYLDRRDPEGMSHAIARAEALLAQSPTPAVGDSSDLTIEQVVDSALSESVRLQVAQGKVLVPLYRAVHAQEAGDEDMAGSQFELALSITREIGDDERHLMEAIVLGQQHRYSEAASAYHRYLEHNGVTGGLADTLEKLVINFGERGTAEARLKDERVHELAATFFSRVRAYADAKTHLDALERLAGPEWWTRVERPWQSLSDYGEVCEGLGRLQPALTYYDRAIAALEVRRGLLSRDELKSALAGGLGAQYLYFQASRAAIKAQEQAHLADNRELASVHAAKAFDYAEHGKARGLLDLMLGSAVIARSLKAQSQTLRSWRQLSARLTTWRGLLARERSQNGHEPGRIVYLEQQIEATEVQLRQVAADLARTNPRFYQAANPQARVMSVDEVRTVLAPGMTLLQYYFLGDDFLAWAIASQGLVQTYRTRVDTKALDRQIRDFHQACKQQRIVDDLGSRLAEIFLMPFDETIRNSSQLMIIPYGTAHLLPFHVLPWEGQPLGATRTISYLPSASTLQFLGRTGAGAPAERLLAVGNPARMAYHSPLGGEPNPQNDLPWAGIEAAYVASLFSEGKALCGGAATERAVRQQISAYSLLHFATHGLLSEEAPLLSSILLAEGEALSLYELLGMRLNADLVVLSACNTGVGETTGGDDVLGMTHGLLGTGARAAVVSLWPVNDMATSLLMGYFYQRLDAGDAPTTALQAAQNYLRTLSKEKIQSDLNQLKAKLEEAGNSEAAHSVDEIRAMRSDAARFAGPAVPSSDLEDYSHPFYWAPFIVVGQ